MPHPTGVAAIRSTFLTRPAWGASFSCPRPPVGSLFPSSRRESARAAQDGPGEPGPQIKSARHGLDETAIATRRARSNPAVRRLRAELQPPADTGREALDADRADSPQDLVEVVLQDALLLPGRRPQA